MNGNYWDQSGQPAENPDSPQANPGNPEYSNPDLYPTPALTDPVEGTATAPSSDGPSALETVGPESFTTPTTTTFTSESTPTDILTTSDSQDDIDANEGDDNGGGGMSNDTKIAIAVPVAIVGAAIIAAIIFFLIRRRRQRQRNSPPVLSSRQLETPSAFLPAQMQPVPAPTVAPINRRSVPGDNEPVPHPSGAETAAPVIPVIAAPDLEWRTSEERAGRPRSPFDHPHDNDDNFSVVSNIHDREAMMRARGPRDDDVSSVSSFEDEPRPGTNRGS
ncbi:hypothetical protein BDW62DRAFT_188386 [Aspergillus aurantiobrunneus]